MQPEFTVFLDENLHRTKSVLEVLAQARISVECHHQHFQAGTPDEQWLPTVGERGWVLLTCDARIRNRHSERAQVIRTRVRAFYFSSNDQPAAELAKTLRSALEQIAELVRSTPPPFFASIQKSGKVTLRHFATDMSRQT